MAGIDFSFLPLFPTLLQAKRIGDSPVADRSLSKNDMVVLSPKNHYLQQTNVPGGIAFDGQYNVFITDCAGSILQDITPNVYIYEFNDRDGIPQLSFEINNIGVDYYSKQLHLLFTKPNTSVAYYSGSFLCTDMYARETVIAEYKSVGFNDLIGIEAIFPQRIGLKLFRTDIDDQTEGKEYNQFNGNTISSDKQIYYKDVYKSEYLNNFAYRRLNVMLAQNILYFTEFGEVNGTRIQAKPFAKKSERLGNTNFFVADFTASRNYNDIRLDRLQITPAFALTSKSPLGAYTLSTITNTISGTFNKPIILGSGNLRLLRNGVLFETYTTADIVVTGNSFQIDTSAVNYTDEDYSIEVDPGLFVSTVGDVYAGGDDWDFYIVPGYYDMGYYNNTFYI